MSTAATSSACRWMSASRLLTAGLPASKQDKIGLLDWVAGKRCSSQSLHTECMVRTAMILT